MRTRGSQGPPQGQHFLKPTIELSGQVNGVDDPVTVTYRLRVGVGQYGNETGELMVLQGMVIRVITKEERSHLVALVRVPDEELEPWEQAQPWYLFNDFTVRSVLEEEALSFQGNWKVCSSHLPASNTLMHSRLGANGCVLRTGRRCRTTRLQFAAHGDRPINSVPRYQHYSVSEILLCYV